MSTKTSQMKPTTRALGALVGGAGTYFAAHWFNAWGLSDTLIWLLSGVMAVVGAMFGPRIWDLIIHFV